MAPVSESPPSANDSQGDTEITRTIAFRHAPTRTATGPRIVASIGVIIFGTLGLIAVLHGVPTFIQDGYTLASLVRYLAGSFAIAVVAWVFLSIRWSPHQDLGLGPRFSAVAITAVALSLAAVAGRLAYERPINQRATDILLLFGVSLALILTVALANRTPISRLLPSMRSSLRAVPRPLLVGGIAVSALAIITRFVLLERYPLVNHNDEWMFIVYARGFRDGVSLNPFRVHEGLLHIELWNWLLGQVSRPFPDTVWAYRLPGAFLGIVSIVATFLLGRRLLDRGVALAGAMVLTVLPLHLWASRNALDNITDAAALPLALWLADRTLETRDRRDAIACGIAMGLGLYGYFGARGFPAIIAVVMVSILFHGPFRRSVVDFIRLGIWMVAGFLVAAAPGLGYFRAEPDTFFGRVRSVTDTVSNRNPTMDERVQRALEGFAYPLSEPTGIFFRAGTSNVSVIGTIGALFIGVGVSVWLLSLAFRVVRKRPQWATMRPGSLLIAWAMLTIPISQSDGMESQRFLALTPIWALAVATGIVMVARGIGRATRNQSIVRLGTAALLIAIAVQSLSWYFNDDREITSWGGAEASRFYDLGWRLRSTPVDTRVIGVSWPEIMYDRTGGMQYWAPGRERYFTFIQPFNEHEPPFGAPRLASGQLLVLGPSHSGDMCLVMNANPHATIGAAHDRYGELLYLVVSTDVDFPFRLDPSPAESTLVIVPPPRCDGTTLRDPDAWPG